MSISGVVVKGGGIVIFVVGILLMLASVGLNLVGLHVGGPLLDALAGLFFLAVGFVLITGRGITA